MGPWILAMAIGFEPWQGSLPARPCTPTAEHRKLPAGPPAEWPLPPMCAQEFEGACTSRDGQVRIATEFDGRRKVKRVRSGFYGGEGWMDDTFFSGRRTLSIEHLPTGRKAVFIERLRDSRGYSAPGASLRYFPEQKLFIALDLAEEKKPANSYCIRLP
jgi:hypothetical protein